jgi:uncharacterized membrane protein (DUF2068 family)
MALPVGCTATMVSQLPGTSALLSLVSFAAVAVGILLLAAAYGLWTIQPWGRALAWWVYVVSIPLGVLAMLGLFPGQETSNANTLFQGLGIAIDFACVIYLGRPEVVGIFDPESVVERYEIRR